MDALSFNYDEGKKRLVFEFPQAVISTNSDELRQKFSTFTQQNNDGPREWNEVLLDFSNTHMIDSLGLNLIIQVLRWLKTKQIKACAIVKSGIVRLIFLNVRLDKQMQIIFTGTPIEGIDNPNTRELHN